MIYALVEKILDPASSKVRSVHCSREEAETEEKKLIQSLGDSTNLRRREAFDRGESCGTLVGFNDVKCWRRFYIQEVG